jgi:hypothetical protein
MSFIMGWFGKSNYEKHEEELSDTLNTILEEELEISELRDLCRNLIGSFPKNGLVLRDKNDNEVYEFEDPISRKHYAEFYSHYEELEEVNDMMLAKYLIKHRLLDEDDEDYEYLMTHDEEDDEEEDDEEEEDDDEEDDDEESKSKDSDYMMDSIILKLEKGFEPEKVYDEKELQNLLRSHLETVFPKAVVKREVSLKHVRGTIDILVDGKYAIEAKIPNNRTELRNLSAQLEEYQEEYPDIIAFLLNNEEKNLDDDIKHYTKRYKSKLGIKSIVKIGNKRG